MTERIEIDTLLGKTVDKVVVSADEVRFHVGADVYRLWHDQDCCESVRVEDVIGDVNDLVGTPIVLAEESTSTFRPTDLPVPTHHDESQTWTFYKLATMKGYVTIRFHGSSNGYYSEGVSFGLM